MVVIQQSPNRRLIFTLIIAPTDRGIGVLTMTIPTIETDEQFFALFLVQQASYNVGTREGWRFKEPMPEGWEAICTAAELAETQWKAKGTFFSEDRKTSVFARYKELRDARHPKNGGKHAASDFPQLMERFSGTMNEDQIYTAALQIVQDWLRGG